MEDVIHVLLLALISGALWHRQLRDSGWKDTVSLLALCISMSVAAICVLGAALFVVVSGFKLLS